MAASLETAEGQVFLVVPSGAVPWRYIRAKLRKAPMKFHRQIERSKIFQRRARGPLYVVGTAKGHVLVPARRMRALSNSLNLAEVAGIG